MNAVAERVDHADDCRPCTIMQIEASDRDVEHLESSLKGDKVARGEFEVDVTKNKVIVAGVGLLAIYHWETSNWGKKIKRLSVERSPADSNDTAPDRYRIVAESSDDSGEKSEVFISDLSEAEAKVVLKKIELGIKELLGVSVLDRALEIPCVDGSVFTIAGRRVSKTKFVLSVLTGAVKMFACCVVGVAAFLALLYFAFQAGYGNSHVPAITQKAPGSILPPLPLPQVATPKAEAVNDAAEPPTDIQMPKEALAPATRATDKRDRR